MTIIKSLNDINKIIAEDKSPLGCIVIQSR
jgi:hypothetical protein